MDHGTMKVRVQGIVFSGIVFSFQAGWIIQEGKGTEKEK